MIFLLMLREKEKWIRKLKTEWNECVQNDIVRWYLVMDKHFSANSILTLPEQEILRSICCIEQQLLIEDNSYLSHKDSSSVNNSKIELEVFWLLWISKYIYWIERRPSASAKQSSLLEGFLFGYWKDEIEYSWSNKWWSTCRSF